MTDLSAVAAPTTTSLTSGIPNVAEARTRQKITETAKTFESAFLSQVLGSLFEGVGESSAFGGGHGEQAFRSLLNDAMAKQMSNRGGIGLAKPIEKEMLRMQGLPALPVHALANADVTSAPPSAAKTRQSLASYGRSLQ